MFRTACALAALTGLAAVCTGHAQLAPDTAKVADVAAGRVSEAKASWWGFDPQDATSALQAAIDSKVPKLVVDNPGKPWVVLPLRLVSNQEILFEEGVEILAKAGEFKGTNDSLLRADNCQNITLRGDKATLRMRRADYDNPDLYQRAEWRHCLSIRSCTNVKVYGLTLAESGGDGIYLGTATQWVTNKDIHIKDVVCDRNYRQGISVITAENLLIENTVMRDTAGTAPQAGIDFEPNHPQERLVNCVLRNCLSEGNRSYAYVLYVRPLNAASAPMSVRFENCRALNNGGPAFGLTTGDTPDLAVDGAVDLVHCVFAAAKTAIVTVGKPANRSRLTLTDCQLLGDSEEPPQPAPVVIASGQHADEAVGGIDFVRCLIRDPLERSPLAYIDRGGGTPIGDIRGTLVIERDGQRSEVTITPELLGKWLPVTAMKQYPRVTLDGMTLRPPVSGVAVEKYAFGFANVRTKGTYLLHASAGDEVTLGVSFSQVGKYQGTTAPITVMGPDGKQIATAEAPFQQQTTVVFRAPVTGVYRVTAEPKQNRLAFVSSTHPLCLFEEGSAPIRLIHSAGEYFFHVPKGTAEFGIRVSGEGVGEAIRAQLVNPEGEVVQEIDNTFQTHQFEVALPTPSAGEAWSLRLSRPTATTWEDHYVDLRGVLPLLAPSREALLVPAE
jgi:hypothetical protein